MKELFMSKLAFFLVTVVMLARTIAMPLTSSIGHSPAYAQAPHNNAAIFLQGINSFFTTPQTYMQRTSYNTPTSILRMGDISTDVSSVLPSNTRYYEYRSAGGRPVTGNQGHTLSIVEPYLKRSSSLSGAQMATTIKPPGPSGSYTVPGLGARKQEILKYGGSVLDMAIAMLETAPMEADCYSYGDGKTGDSANFGIFKQNWYMIRSAVPRYRSLTARDYNTGAALNGNLSWDIQVLQASQQFYGLDTWFAGQRDGQTGLAHPDTTDINNYKQAVYWIRDQLNSNPKYLTDDTRFWVQVPAI